jgi:UDP-2,3-diacylglucosamine pyrophosphatase LpxH
MAKVIASYDLGGVMIRWFLTLCAALAALPGCAQHEGGVRGIGAAPDLAGPAQRLSRPMVSVTDGEALPQNGLRVGFVADSQIQTRSNYNRVRGYRGPIEDSRVQGAIRPPALDWAARSMLRSDLTQLVRQGANVIFFLGDGANNGCYDEFARGFADNAALAPNDASILSLLAEFRRTHQVPVYFILGNHDILGAGSTSAIGARKRFCKAEVGVNRHITKFEAMKWTDEFNQGNAGLPNAGTYRSNWTGSEDAIRRNCGGAKVAQDKKRGCYLAATVDAVIDGRTAQFLLLDTNDWADVVTLFPGFQQKGARGAMTFVNKGGIVSQTRWFNDHASQRVDLRVALSHYDIVGLRSQLLKWKFSKKSQRYLELFTEGHEPAVPIQTQAYVVTGHTHTRAYVNEWRPFAMDCGALPGSCADTNRFQFVELNIGSTTDYTSFATLAQFDPDPAKPADVYFKRVEVRGCEAVWAEIERGIGWPALGVDPAHRYSYRKLKLHQVQPIWDRLLAYAGDDEHKLNCIGVYSAAVEAGAEGKPQPVDQ